MNKKIYALGALLLSASVVTGADTLIVRSLGLSPLLPIQSPILLDSTNVNNQKFDQKNLLTESSFNLENLQFTPTQADREFTLNVPQEGFAIGYARFFIHTQDFAKAQLLVKGSPMYEVHVDGKVKTTKDKTPLNLEPGGTEVAIKYLVSQGQKDSKLEIQVASDSPELSLNTSPLSGLTIETLMTGERVSGVSLSPNGKYAHVALSLTNEAGKKSAQAYIIELKSQQKIHQVTGLEGLGWMPNGDAIYYRAKEVEGDNLVSLDLKSGLTTVLSRNIPVGNFQMTPDGKKLIFSEIEKPKAKQKDVYEILSPDDRIPGNRFRYNLFQYDLATGLKQRITYGYQSVSLEDIHPSSQKIILGQSFRKLDKLPFSAATYLEVDLNSLKVDTLFHKATYINSVKYGLEEGDYLITGAGYALGEVGLNIKEGQTANSFDGQAFIWNRATGNVQAISKDFAPAIDRALAHRPSKQYFFQCTDRDYENVYAYHPKSQKFEELPLDIDVISNFSLARNANEMIYYGSSVDRADQIMSYSLSSKSPQLILDPEAERYAEVELGEVKDWNFTSNGTEIAGRYYLPTNFDPNKKYPMVVYYYSGTSPTSRSFYHPYSMHLYAAQGYVVYVLQPSGTIGYGQAFSARHVNAWGKQTADDIITGVKQFCQEHTFVDASKVGCMGASYGGFMTMYLQTRTDIFAAAVSHAGISALSSYWGEGYWGYSYSSIATAGSYPWNAQELYLEQSPLFNAEKINTPLLLLHGTADTNVPAGESIQMFNALKILGKEVNFVQVKGENHGIADFEKRLAWKKTIFAFFAKHLKGEKLWWEEMYSNPINF